MSEVKYPDVEVVLVGEDGNAFSIIGKVSKALKREVGHTEAEEFRDEAFNAESYDHLLQIVQRTVVVA